MMSSSPTPVGSNMVRRSFKILTDPGSVLVVESDTPASGPRVFSLVSRGTLCVLTEEALVSLRDEIDEQLAEPRQSTPT